MKWEYQILRIVKDNDSTNLRRLREIGKEGWELVSVDNGIAYFKRPTEEIPPAIVVVYTDKSHRLILAPAEINRYLQRPVTTELKTVDTRAEYKQVHDD